MSRMASTSVKVPRPRTRTRTVSVAVVSMCLLAAVIAGAAVAHVARRHSVIRFGYELTEATAELRRLKEENRRLRVEKSILTHPQRIEKLAASLGMSRPAAGQVRVVRETQISQRSHRAGGSERIDRRAPVRP